MNGKNSRMMLLLKNIKKSFGNLVVLNEVSAEIKEAELVTFVGPSGCGKTTLLRIIGGFTPPDSGEVILDGQRIDHLPPNLRDTSGKFPKQRSNGDNVSPLPLPSPIKDYVTIGVGEGNKYK